MDKELVIVLDFGGQYNQLVARRVRECNVYCEIYSYKTDIEKIKAMNPKGIILTGGPNSCYEEDSPSYQKELFELGIPVLGLCYGAQLMMHKLGGKVITPEVGEYGKTEIHYAPNAVLFQGMPETSICWMSHFDRIETAAPGFEVVAHTADCPIAAAQNVEKKLYAIQFHPEVLHTVNGTQMIYNFVRNVCGCAGTWRMDSFVEETIQSIREKVGRCGRNPVTRDRKTADLCLCRPWSLKKGRRRRGRERIRAKWPVRLKLHSCQCAGALLRKTCRCHRTGEKT